MVPSLSSWAGYLVSLRLTFLFYKMTKHTTHFLVVVKITYENAHQFPITVSSISPAFNKYNFYHEEFLKFCKSGLRAFLLGVTRMTGRLHHTQELGLQKDLCGLCLMRLSISFSVTEVRQIDGTTL